MIDKELTDWQVDGGLVYRLKNGVNCDEINVTMANGSRGNDERYAAASAVLVAISALATTSTEPAAPAILEAISWHAGERDDLTLEDAVEALRHGYKKVRQRDDRAMLLQLIDLMASGPAKESAPEIKTWQERLGPDWPFMQTKLCNDEMLAEIADLRAALASRGAAQGRITQDDSANFAAPASAIASPAAAVAAPTDLSQRLREKVYGGTHPDFKADILAAADEIERYYGGMMNWKANAQQKDRQMAEYREKIAALESAPAAPVAGSQQVPAGRTAAEAIERIFQSWDGCKYDNINVGEALREDFAAIPGFADFAAAAPAAPVPAAEPSKLTDQAVREVVGDMYLRMQKSYMAEPTRRITFMDMEAVHEHVKRLGLGGCLDAAAMAAPSLQQPKEGASDA